jgi:hypothetical protein
LFGAAAARAQQYAWLQFIFVSTLCVTAIATVALGAPAGSRRGIVKRVFVSTLDVTVLASRNHAQRLAESLFQVRACVSACDLVADLVGQQNPNH